MVYDSFFFCFVGTFGLWRKLVGLFLYHDSLTYLKIPYLFSMTGWTLAIQKCEVGFLGGKKSRAWVEKGVKFIEFSKLMGEIDTTLRIMGSQNWWFGDLGTLLYRVFLPSIGGSKKFLGNLYKLKSINCRKSSSLCNMFSWVADGPAVCRNIVEKRNPKACMRREFSVLLTLCLEYCYVEFDWTGPGVTFISMNPKITTLSTMLRRCLRFMLY